MTGALIVLGLICAVVVMAWAFGSLDDRITRKVKRRLTREHQQRYYLREIARAEMVDSVGITALIIARESVSA